MREKSFNRISVTAIIKKAGVNRSTFYAHYLDKYDLLDKIEDNLIDEITQISAFSDIDRNFQAIQSNVEDILMFIYEKRELFQIMTDPDLGSAFKNKISHVIDRRWQKHYEKEIFTVPTKYVQDAFVGMLAHLIFEWVQNDFSETVEELSSIICTLLQSFYGSIINEG